jgi:hypothetical protein|tara:strand:+ start:7442 stop:7627 length:186 start_codon:yes stop_codon:yes gene_type:complete
MIAAFAPVIAGTVKTMALSFLSEKLLIKVVFLLLEKLVKSTENELDDKILEEYKKSMAGNL